MTGSVLPSLFGTVITLLSKTGTPKELPRALGAPRTWHETLGSEIRRLVTPSAPHPRVETVDSGPLPRSLRRHGEEVATFPQHTVDGTPSPVLLSFGAGVRRRRRRRGRGTCPRRHLHTRHRRGTPGLLPPKKGYRPPPSPHPPVSSDPNPSPVLRGTHSRTPRTPVDLPPPAPLPSPGVRLSRDLGTFPPWHVGVPGSPHNYLRTSTDLWTRRQTDFPRGSGSLTETDRR